MIFYLNLNILPQLRTLQQAKRNLKRKQRYRTFSQKNMFFTTFWKKPSERLKILFFPGLFCQGFEIEWVGAVYLPGKNKKNSLRWKKNTPEFSKSPKYHTVFIDFIYGHFRRSIKWSANFPGKKKNVFISQGRAANKFLKNEREWLRGPQTCPGKRIAYFWKT